MAIERIYHCDGPDCEVHVRTATPPPYLPVGFYELRERAPVEPGTWHFCSWDCLMKYAAKQPAQEVIPWDDLEPPGDEGEGR